ncbi:hypothetical protein ACP3WA_24595, partial [Salmonella enterica]|uniref:hypothetical protein n=1 Tax=Salmonella enterica TaxID=28901 RepID=UPI003CF05676
VEAYNLTYQLELPGKATLDKPQLLTSWMGLPGAGFGGMSAPTGTASLFSSAYSFSPSRDALQQMPIAVWSTKGVIGRWSEESSSPIVA